MIFKAIISVLLLLTWFVGSIQAKDRDTVQINILLERSRNLQRIYVDSCYLLAAQAYRLSLPINYKAGISAAFIRMGSVLMTKGYNDSAMHFIREALRIGKELKDPGRTTSAYILISYVYQYKGWQDSAFAALYQAIRSSASEHDTANLILTYKTLADLKYNYADYKGAMKAYLESARLAQVSNSNAHITAYLGMGNVAYKQGKIMAALQYYLSVDSLSKRFHDPVTRVQNMNNIALCYADIRKFDQAVNYYQMAIAGYLGYGMKSELSNAYYNLGLLYTDMGNTLKSVEYLNRALNMAQGIGEFQKMADCYQALSRALALQGDFIKAYQFQVKYIDLTDSLLNKEKVKSISEMQVKYETEKKESEIKLLDAQRITSRSQRNFFIAGSIVLLLILFVLVFYFIQKQKLAAQKEELNQKHINELLSTQELKTYNAVIEGQEAERQRIAEDLHDRLGSMLATIKVLFSGIESKMDHAREESVIQYDKAGKLLDEACKEVRRISHNMSSTMVMSFGLTSALRELCQSIDDSGLIRCKLQSYGQDSRIVQQIEIGCYRIVQELLGNSLKHAKAKQIVVQLNYTENTLIITVEDDGTGFNPTELKSRPGMGMANVESRTKQLNGTFHIDSAPGKGTVSIIEIPINQMA